MASGGAGKVYFVLYLAVILELLIIIVERDEAEEHLIQKQKETMRIVESILSQLQTGAGSEGISTKPKDEITLQEPGQQVAGGPEIRQDREYEIEVGITDITGHDEVDPHKEGAEEKIKMLTRLANVQELEYQIYYHPSLDPDKSPDFPAGDTLDLLKLESEGQIVGEKVDGDHWRLQFVRKLELDTVATENWSHPVYKPYSIEIGKASEFAPAEAVKVDSVFRYDQLATDKLAEKENGKYKKRVFTVKYQAPAKPGWYKLRFASRTNKILGLGGDVPALSIEEVPDDAKVNIGTVQLKVKELKTVHKELTKRLDGMGIPDTEALFVAASQGTEEAQIAASTFDRELIAAKDRLASQMANLSDDENEAARMISQVELYGYIGKLLAPNMSDYFEQNQGNKEIDIRVIKPPVNIADPYVDLPEEGVFVFDKLRPAFLFSSGPFQGNNFPTGQIITAGGLVPLEVQEISGLASADANAKGSKKFYRAVASRTIAPGTYDIEMVQKNASKTKTESTKLEVFASTLTEDSKSDLEFKLNTLTYGYPLIVKAVPSSAGKIPAGQFRVYANTDVDQQRPPVYNLTTNLPLAAAANSASLRITWVSPYTEEEVDLFPAKSKDISQEPPIFDFSRINPKASGTSTKKFTVRVRDVIVLPPAIDTASREASAEDIQTPEVSGVEASLSPPFEIEDSFVEDQGDGYYTVVMNLAGNLGREPEVTGTLTVTLSTQVRNPINGKMSEATSDIFTVNVSHEPPRKRRGGPRRPR